MSKIDFQLLKSDFQAIESSTLFYKYKEQLNKDLHLSGISEIEIRSDNLEVIFQNLKDLVHQLMSKDLEKLGTFLYRIDIKESHINNLFEKMDPEMIDKICQLIMYRELEKVIRRKVY